MFLSNMFSGLKKGLFGSEGDRASKSAAKSRLQFVLVQDRAGMSSEEMGKFKRELITVIEKYFKLEKEKFDITYKRAGETTTLLINSPVMIRRTSGQQQNHNEHKNKHKDRSSSSAQVQPVANS